MSMRFEGRSVIVTGAGSGIGRATARAFAAEGARVIVADVTGAEEVAQQIEHEGGTALPIAIDAGVDADVKRAVVLAQERHGGLDVMVANAGISGGLPGLFDTDPALFAEVLRVNLLGPFLAVRHAAPAIVAGGRGPKPGGAIVLTASVAGLRSGAGSPAYSASKAGVINLAQVAAQQLAGSNVRVNAVCPGLIETAMTQMVYDGARAAGKVDRLGRLNPLRRGGEPEEIAEAILFLASDAASYVNGHAMVIDGGLSSSLPFHRQDYGRTAV